MRGSKLSGAPWSASSPARCARTSKSRTRSLSRRSTWSSTSTASGARFCFWLFLFWNVREQKKKVHASEYLAKLCFSAQHLRDICSHRERSLCIGVRRENRILYMRRGFFVFRPTSGCMRKYSIYAFTLVFIFFLCARGKKSKGERARDLQPP